MMRSIDHTQTISRKSRLNDIFAMPLSWKRILLRTNLDLHSVHNWSFYIFITYLSPRVLWEMMTMLMPDAYLSSFSWSWSGSTFDFISPWFRIIDDKLHYPCKTSPFQHSWISHTEIVSGQKCYLSLTSPSETLPNQNHVTFVDRCHKLHIKMRKSEFFFSSRTSFPALRAQSSLVQPRTTKASGFCHISGRNGIIRCAGLRFFFPVFILPSFSFIFFFTFPFLDCVSHTRFQFSTEDGDGVWASRKHTWKKKWNWLQKRRLDMAFR